MAQANKKDQRNTLHHVHHQKKPIENKDIKKIRSCVKKKTLQKKGITLNKQNLADKQINSINTNNKLLNT